VIIPKDWFADNNALNVFVLLRALTYSALFVGLLLVYLPARVLSRAGSLRPTENSAQQVLGLAIATAGGLLALWCILTFVAIGRGTPAPFDPPRRLVIRGPYRFVRNPMYIGAGLALAGAALYSASFSLLAYAAVFLLATHLLVVGYEEPALRQNFGEEYEAYCSRVRRWWPRAWRG
jgi:protein-S-isoprenylcysteine O-methyltransferase Ste14